jgi:hypothetical protein
MCRLILVLVKTSKAVTDSLREYLYANVPIYQAYLSEFLREQMFPPRVVENEEIHVYVQCTSRRRYSLRQLNRSAHMH